MQISFRVAAADAAVSSVTVPFLLCGKNGSGVGTHGGSLWSGGRLDTDTLTAAASQQ